MPYMIHETRFTVGSMSSVFLDYLSKTFKWVNFQQFVPQGVLLAVEESSSSFKLISKRYDIGSCLIKFKTSSHQFSIVTRFPNLSGDASPVPPMVSTEPLESLEGKPRQVVEEFAIVIPFMKDLSNPLEYGAPYQAILRDYYSKFEIPNYNVKPYFVIGKVGKT